MKNHRSRTEEVLTLLDESNTLRPVKLLNGFQKFRFGRPGPLMEQLGKTARPVK